MRRQFYLMLAIGAMATLAAYGQPTTVQIGYAANLNIGDSVINISNDGSQGGFINATPVATQGNICVNAYTFDPQEEMLSCCSCLITPDGIDALWVKADLLSNTLTPATPSSVTIVLSSTEPALDRTGAYSGCNPAGPISPTVASNPYYPAAGVPLAGAADTHAGFAVPFGMLAWGATLEPSATPGTYSPVAVRYLITSAGAGYFPDAPQTCAFLQSDGTGYGICKGCQTGALSGAKR